MRSVCVHPKVERVLQRASSSAQSGPDSVRTGLLLGQCWDQRCYLLSCVWTPPLPGEGGWNATEWFAAHVKQVQRMSVGGVEIVGACLSECEKGSTAASAVKQMESDGRIRNMIAALPTSSTTSTSSAQSDRFLLKYIGNKMSVDAYSGSNNDILSGAVKPKPVASGSVKVLDWTSGDQVHCLTTMMNIDLSVAVVEGESGTTSLEAQLTRSLHAFHASLNHAPVLIDGRATDASATLDRLGDDGSSNAQSTKGKGGKGGGKGGKKANVGRAANEDASSSSTPIHQIDFFVRPMPVPPVPENCSGGIRIRGACNFRTYAHNKCSVAQAMQSLRSDILNSLSSRLQLLVEDSEDQFGSFALPSADQLTYTWQLPRRLFQPIQDELCVCDYLLAHESPEDGVGRIRELLLTPGDVSSSWQQPFCNEKVPTATAGAQQQLSNSSKPQSCASTPTSSTPPSTHTHASDSSKSSRPPSFYIFAFLAALFAILLSFWKMV